MKKNLYLSAAFIVLGVGIGWTQIRRFFDEKPVEANSNLPESHLAHHGSSHHDHHISPSSSPPDKSSKDSGDSKVMETTHKQQMMDEGHDSHHNPRINKAYTTGMVTTTVVEKSLSYGLRSFGEVAIDPELYQAQSEHLEIKSRAPQTTDPLWTEMINVSRTRLKALGISHDHIISLEKKGRPEESLITSQGPDPLIIYAYVSEDDLPDIFTGQKVGIIQGWMENISAQGRVMYKDDRINSKTRSGLVRIQLKSKPPSLRGGSQVQIEFMWPAEKHITVPFDSLLQRSDGAYIFLFEDEKIVPAKVDVLMISGEAVAIRNRFYLGRTIVRHSPFLWDADTRISLDGDSSHSHHHH